MNKSIGVVSRAQIPVQFQAGSGGEEPARRPWTQEAVPDYLRETYDWAYLDPRHVAVLDHQLVVSSILWGNANRLIRATLAEFQPGQDVLQPACVYGSLSPELAARLGRRGRLEVRDVAPVQLEHTARKLAAFPQASTRQANAAEPVGRQFDAVCCFFLLHEVPDAWKRRIVDALLAAVPPGGKVVFTDYHRMAALHPLRPVMWGVFRWLEPYADSLCRHGIQAFASRPQDFAWRKETYFGGLYQKVVAERLA